MVSEIAKTFLEFLNLAPRLLAALGFAAGLLLSSSDQLLKRLGLGEFVQRWRFGIGLTFVICIALLVAHLGGYLLGWIKGGWRERKSVQYVTERLHRLTEEEKQILRYYLTFNTRANMLRVDNGVVQQLVSEGIIYQSATLGNLFEGFAHNIGDVAWDYLNAHPELLQGTTKTYYTDKRARFRR